MRGGRIGSNLAELVYLELGDLARYLADYQGVEVAPKEWIERIDERALKLIPSSLIRRYRVLPLRLETDEIHLAMLDPTDRHQLNLLSDMAWRSVQAYSLPEVGLLYWLEVYFGMDHHPRYSYLSARNA